MAGWQTIILEKHEEAEINTAPAEKAVVWVKVRGNALCESVYLNVLIRLEKITMKVKLFEGIEGKPSTALTV